jgi:hypothetical protein
MRVHLFRLTDQKGNSQVVGALDLFDFLEVYFSTGDRFAGDARWLKGWAERGGFKYEHKTADLDFNSL